MSQTHNPRRNQPPSQSPSVLENLEVRRLFATRTFRVVDYFADNRGQAEIFFNKPVDTATLTRSTVKVFVDDGNGQFDANLSRKGLKFGYDPASKRLLIKAPYLATNTRYRIQLAGVRTTAGEALDGEHNPGEWSGNGTPGGNFDMTTKAAANNRVRFATSLGFINVVLFKRDVPLTITNFKHYADEGSWDGTFFHRSVKSFKVIQGGGFNVVNGDEIGEIHAHDGVTDEFARDNDKGTIAMAKTDAPNTSTNQWYFNVTDNSADLDNRFSVFGVVMDAESQTTIERINNLTVVDADGGVQNAFGEIPVRDAAAGAQRAINIPGDLVVVSRVAMQMDAEDSPGTGAAPVSTASVSRSVPRAQATTPASATPTPVAFSTKRVSKERVFD